MSFFSAFLDSYGRSDSKESQFAFIKKERVWFRWSQPQSKIRSPKIRRTKSQWCKKNFRKALTWTYLKEIFPHLYKCFIIQNIWLQYKMVIWQTDEDIFALINNEWVNDWILLRAMFCILFSFLFITALYWWSLAKFCWTTISPNQKKIYVGTILNNKQEINSSILIKKRIMGWEKEN